MALGITATFVDATGTAQITITGETADAGDWVVLRTDRFGTAQVRTQAGLDLTAPTVLADSEVALSGPVTYTVTVGASSESASLTPVSSHAWLGFPLQPNYNVQLPAVGSDFEQTYTPADEVLQPFDSDVPVIITGKFGMRAGRFSILVDDDDAANAIVAAYRRIRVAHLRTANQSLYHVASEYTIAPASPRAAQRIVRGRYTERQSPIGDLLGTLGWTYALTTALGNTYAEIPAVFPTYADRSTGAFT